VDDVEAALRRAAGVGARRDPCPAFGGNWFYADLGCGARVEFGNIDGKFVGSVSLLIPRLTPEAAEAILNLLRTRNEPNSIYQR
jgi:hypothetical protein